MGSRNPKMLRTSYLEAPRGGGEGSTCSSFIESSSGEGVSTSAWLSAGAPAGGHQSNLTIGRYEERRRRRRSTIHSANYCTLRTQCASKSSQHEGTPQKITEVVSIKEQRQRVTYTRSKGRIAQKDIYLTLILNQITITININRIYYMSLEAGFLPSSFIRGTRSMTVARAVDRQSKQSVGSRKSGSP